MVYSSTLQNSYRMFQIIFSNKPYLEHMSIWVATFFFMRTTNTDWTVQADLSLSWAHISERCGAVVKRRTRDREVPGLIPTNSKCCFLEQETLSTLLSTGFYPGKKRATWKISTRLLNVLPSINKVDYYYYYYYFKVCFLTLRYIYFTEMYT